MPYRTTTSFITVAAFALLSVAMPEPIVLDALGTGLASIGLSILYEGFV